METQEQHKKQYDWLKGYQFKKGTSGNPGGRKKGSKSLKVWAREYLEDLPDEEKIEFLSTIPGELVWRMAEGQPRQDNVIEGGDLPIMIKIINGGK
jgi:hypothetical protein